MFHERHMAKTMQPKPSVGLYGFCCLIRAQQALIIFWFIIRVEAVMGLWVSGSRMSETIILGCRSQQGVDWGEWSATSFGSQWFLVTRVSKTNMKENYLHMHNGIVNQRCVDVSWSQ